MSLLPCFASEALGKRPIELPRHELLGAHVVRSLRRRVHQCICMPLSSLFKQSSFVLVSHA